jgi:hypothetical protein
VLVVSGSCLRLILPQVTSIFLQREEVVGTINSGDSENAALLERFYNDAVIYEADTEFRKERAVSMAKMNHNAT